MAIPLAIPAAGTALKLLAAKLGIGAAGKGIGAGLTAAGKVAAAQGPRMAASGVFKQGLGRAMFGDMTKGQLINRLAPDAFFGGIAALQTPGDIGDKLIAGTTSAVGGGLGGLALGRAGQRFGDTAGFMADMAGSIGGDMVGMSVGDGLQRGKDSLMGGSGQTAYERMSAEQQAQFAEEIRRQTLATAGLVPGVRDQFMYENGLG
jgi:hypothetical protein